jgi:hypothetical protein
LEIRENCRRRLAAKFGIGSRLLLSQGQDGRNLLEDDVQLESLLEDTSKIEIHYLKGFDHPHIMKLLEDICRTSFLDPKKLGISKSTSFNRSKFNICQLGPTTMVFWMKIG